MPSDVASRTPAMVAELGATRPSDGLPHYGSSYMTLMQSGGSRIIAAPAHPTAAVYIRCDAMYPCIACDHI